jgi:glycosyltransferase involved in cell wall biosynthesis
LAKFKLLPRTAALHVLERRCLRRADGITVFSNFTRDLLRKLHGARIARRASVVSGWANLEQFQVADGRVAARRRLGWPTDSPILFTVRRLVPRMGLSRLIQALRAVQASGRAFHMVIAGEGPLHASLSALSRSLGLESSIRFAGRVDEQTLSDMYRAADAFVLPSSALECFGLIAVEALASGVLVLATPAGAIPEIVSGIEPQWLARDESVNAIGELIARFLDGQLPEHPPSELRAYVERRYSRTDRVADLAAAALGPPGEWR